MEYYTELKSELLDAEVSSIEIDFGIYDRAEGRRFSKEALLE